LQDIKLTRISQRVSRAFCNRSVGPMTGWGQSRRFDDVRVISAFLLIATECGHRGMSQRCHRRKSHSFDHLFATHQHLAAMIIRAAQLHAILLRNARRLLHADKGPARLWVWKHASWDSLAAAEPPPFVLAPAVRPLRCLRRRYVIQLESPNCHAMPLPPRMPLRHSGPGRNVRVQSRCGYSSADQLDSGAWRAFHL
jgi:hypothetical protein